MRIIKQVIIFIMFISIFSHIGIAQKTGGFENFITKSGNQLLDGDQVFRFISFNIPNLNFVEDEMAFARKHPFGLPTEYEMRDALKSVKQMGGKVVRTYTIPVRKQDEDSSIPKYVLAPGEFSEEAFVCMDKMLAIANQVGIRLIIPLLNNWKWMGGRPQYAAFRDKKPDEFWTDPQLIKDFKKTVDYVLNRKNTITGIKYKNDKAILCWETGNELTSPQDWSHEIMEYIKSIDKNHLVMDGFHNSSKTIPDRVVNDPASDIVTTHHYEKNPLDVLKHIAETLEKVKRTDKAYIIGEFGFLGTPALASILEKVITEKEISGALIWSLRYHRKDGGFYWHSEPLGGGIFKAYHWPGFPSGSDYDESNLLELMRNKAFQIQNKGIPELNAPNPPKLLPINNVADISWKGSTGASDYDILRADEKDGPWKIISENISDAGIQYYPLYHDETAQIGKKYYYKVIAKHSAGNSEPSNIVGPVAVSTQAFVDNMEDFMKMYHRKGELTIATDEDRKFKEDRYRISVSSGSKIVYYVPGNITDFKIYLFCQEENDILDIFSSASGESYKKLKTGSTSYFAGKGDYGYWYPILYQSQGPVNNSYLKLDFKQNSQISRVEIYYE